MILKSELKHLFSDELLKQLASICDTLRIDSSQRKMKLVHQLLKRNGIKFGSVGGATNRVTLFIDTYAVKFALDRQGYRDNLIEYSLSRELQPYVPKTYESNGYCLVAECVKTMSLDDFRIRKSDILRVLEILSKDYLLGDVGYITKNFTNWGIRDDGSVVILDYAYVHRATENLFSCEVCGEGVLRYDSTFSYLKCSNATVCTAKFEYIDRKNVQGDQVDLDMIAEMKEVSLKIPKGKVSVEVANQDGILTRDNKIVIDTLDKYTKYLEEKVMKMLENYDTEAAMDILVKIGLAKTDVEREKLRDELEKLVHVEDDSDDTEYEITYDENKSFNDEDEFDDNSTRYKTLDELIAQSRATSSIITTTNDNDEDVQYETSQVQFIPITVSTSSEKKKTATKPEPVVTSTVNETVNDVTESEESTDVDIQDGSMSSLEQEVDDTEKKDTLATNVNTAGIASGTKRVSTITINGEPLY